MTVLDLQQPVASPAPEATPRAEKRLRSDRTPPPGTPVPAPAAPGAGAVPADPGPQPTTYVHPDAILLTAPTAPTATPAVAAASVGAADVAGAPAPLATEASVLGRVVALLTPLFTILAGAVASWVARKTGAKLDSTEITALMVAGSTAAFGACWKWIQGWQQHEMLVAEGRDLPRKAGPAIPR